MLTLVYKAVGFLAYYSIYWSGRAIYSMLTAEPSAIALVALL